MTDLTPLALRVSRPISLRIRATVFLAAAKRICGMEIPVRHLGPARHSRGAHDHLYRHGVLAAWYPYISALFLFVITLEASIDKREEIMREASKWTEYPELVPELRFWRIIPASVLPMFLLLHFVPKANIPYIYAWFGAAVTWLFNLRFAGSAIKFLAGTLGVALFLGCLTYLLLRTFQVVRARSSR